MANLIDYGADRVMSGGAEGGTDVSIKNIDSIDGIPLDQFKTRQVADKAYGPGGEVGPAWEAFNPKADNGKGAWEDAWRVPQTAEMGFGSGWDGLVPASIAAKIPGSVQYTDFGSLKTAGHLEDNMQGLEAGFIAFGGPLAGQAITGALGGAGVAGEAGMGAMGADSYAAAGGVGAGTSWGAGTGAAGGLSTAGEVLADGASAAAPAEGAVTTAGTEAANLALADQAGGMAPEFGTQATYDAGINSGVAQAGAGAPVAAEKAAEAAGNKGIIGKYVDPLIQWAKENPRLASAGLQVAGGIGSAALSSVSAAARQKAAIQAQKDMTQYNRDFLQSGSAGGRGVTINVKSGGAKPLRRPDGSLVYPQGIINKAIGT